MAATHYRFKPWNVGRFIVWTLFALLLIAAPQLFASSLALTMLSQMGYLIIICLSYNMLLGQGGMLSFGHAVYTGLGSFIAIHAINLAGAGQLPIPLPFMPLVGGLAGLFFAVLLGYVTTKKSGTTFAMITLGIGELIAAMALMFPEFFGGEGGVTTNRVYGQALWGISFGPAIEVYYLIAVYCFACTAAMFAFTGTPLGRILNAVRDNPERVEFIGYDTQRVRYLAFCIAGFFAGVGGALAAINFEIVTGADSVSMVRSGGYLLFTFLGGATFFFGPIIGAVLLVLASVLLSELTKGWLLYLGLVFL
ncbi:MAG TPA: branched-chain amino acid ABC transporter permease, partial [Alicycliphilus sp.]|nr:branched-chain amino acid ABC transporter permease [Alicycliphilus sp.]